jgi:1-acyl-sn-glycerol-3-phosphate acyltransferase
MLRRSLHLLYGCYAALAFALVAIPVCALVIVMPTLPLRRAVGRAGTRLSMWAIGQPLRIQGLEQLPKSPCVCVANHASYLDGLVLTAALPARFTFLVQSRAAHWPLVGRTLARMGVVFVNRGSAREAAQTTRDLLRRLQHGNSLTIFAEGTFERPAGLMAFHSGAFVLASKAQVPVVPAVIRGTRQLFGDGQRLPGWSRVSIEFLPALPPQGAGRDAANTLRDAARAAILARCGEPDATRTRPEPLAVED